MSGAADPGRTAPPAPIPTAAGPRTARPPAGQSGYLAAPGGVRRYHAAHWDEPLVLELGSPGERGYLPPATEPGIAAAVGDVLSRIPSGVRRTAPPALPELSQPQVLRHFLRLSQMTLGAHLTPDASEGTCTMKYSPLVNEAVARSPRMTELHPRQADETVQGILEVVWRFERILSEISGLDAFSFQPGGGAQGIFANACIIRAFHESRGEADRRDEIITTAFSHPADAAAPSVAGFRVITLMPGERGFPDVDALRAAISPRTAGLMMTNPEDTGIFNPEVAQFTRLVHEAGGLCAYDQANANGILGITRAREAGFDLCQFNLHKTFSTPHGSIGPAGGAVGATAQLERFLPSPVVRSDGTRFWLDHDRPDSIGRVRSFHGNFQVVLRAYAWVMALGAEGLRQVAETAALNNNYLATCLAEVPGVEIPYPGGGRRIEQVRYSWEPLHEATGITTDELHRRIVDFGMQAYTTSHVPMLVPEPFTLEPSESQSKADLDEYVAIFSELSREAREEPDVVRSAPHAVAVGQVDEAAIDDPARWAMTWRGLQRKRAASDASGR
jgi:glycine dehydrogenase subunit 2